MFQFHVLDISAFNRFSLLVYLFYIHMYFFFQLEKAKLNPGYPFLLPKSYNDCSSYAPFIKSDDSHRVRCQVLRSVSSWSAGFLESDTIEQSIHEAYIDAISTAKR